MTILSTSALADSVGGFATVPTAVQPFVDSGDIAGAVTLVATKDRIQHIAAIGVSDLASGRALQPDDLFWTASMSKPIVAVAVALLVDDGKLSFDDSVESYLPEFRGQSLEQGQAAARPVTLRDLLTHTSGLGEYPVSDPHWTLAEFTRVIARTPLRFQPGTNWAYSTAGIDSLGRVVEVVSGQPFADFLQQRLFNPLAMTDTTFWPSPAQEQRLARTYVPDAATGKLTPAPIPFLYGGAITDRARPPLGGAGLFSTAGDMVKFYQMMLNGGTAGGRRILQPATVAELIRKQTGDFIARPGMPWGLGFCVIEDPTQMTANSHLSPDTFGHGGAHGTQSWADPATGIIYVFLIQRENLMPHPDDSLMRRAYQDAVDAAYPATLRDQLPQLKVEQAQSGSV